MKQKNFLGSKMIQNSGVNPSIMAKGAALMDEYHRFATAPNIFRMGPGENTPAAQGGVNANINFPVQLSTTDPEDSKFALRQQTVTNEGVVPGVGLAIADSNYFDYAKRKVDAETLFQFQQFMMQQAKLDTPEAASWWFEHFPWMRQLREDEIKKQAELQARYALIQINGPQNEEDFLMLWMKDNDLIRVANVPVHMLGQAQGITAGNYQTGFFGRVAQKFLQGMLPTKTDNQAALVSWANPIAPLAGRGQFPGIVGSEFPGNAAPQAGSAIWNAWAPGAPGNQLAALGAPRR